MTEEKLEKKATHHLKENENVMQMFLEIQELKNEIQDKKIKAIENINSKYQPKLQELETIYNTTIKIMT